MEYQEAFKNREGKYEYAVSKYTKVLKREFEIAVEVLDLKHYHSVVNIPAGGIPIDNYIDPSLDIQYLPFEPLREEQYKDIRHCDFTDIPLEDDSVDRILSLASFHHVQEKRIETLKELRRILKKGGQLVIGDVVCGSRQDNWLNVFVNTYNSNGHQGKFLEESEANVLEQLGFKVETFVYTYDWIFDNDNNAIDFVKNLFGLDKLQSNNNDSFLLNALKEILGYEDNKFEWCLMYFRCTKV
jgi:SAM-dependent methyltransferase